MDLYAPFQRRFRPRRLKLFYNLFGINSSKRILDLGGGYFFWDLAKELGLPLPQVTILNIRPPKNRGRSYVQWIIGDAKCTHFDDNSFDVIFSNSLIEHLENWESQLQFANEVRRLAPNYFVQTPDKRFPVEPHFVTPFVHWLPRELRARILRNGTLWGVINRPSHSLCQELVREIQLLGPKQMRNLFPDSKIMFERFAGLPKSLVAFKVHSREREGAL